MTRNPLNIFAFRDPYTWDEIIIIKSRFDKKFRIYKIKPGDEIDFNVHRVLTIDEVFLINEELGEEGLRYILEGHYYYSKKRIIEMIQERLKELSNSEW